MTETRDSSRSNALREIILLQIEVALKNHAHYLTARLRLEGRFWKNRATKNMIKEYDLKAHYIEGRKDALIEIRDLLDGKDG